MYNLLGFVKVLGKIAAKWIYRSFVAKGLKLFGQVATFESQYPIL
jgi:hypothetical protein